jgi:hypothetical protein
MRVNEAGAAATNPPRDGQGLPGGACLVGLKARDRVGPRRLTLVWQP